MNLLQNEDQLIIFNTGRYEEIVLTNYRIIYNSNKSNYKSIFLEDISSFELKSRTNSIFLIIGIILLCIGLSNITNKNLIADLLDIEDGIKPTFWFLLFGILFIISYLGSTVNFVRIYSNGGSNIEFKSKIKHSEIEDFIENIQEAKLNRVNYLS